jgi:murein DD-endopeptidase MepM/ murein hydrolase activator NlpD
MKALLAFVVGFAAGAAAVFVTMPRAASAPPAPAAGAPAPGVPGPAWAPPSLGDVSPLGTRRPSAIPGDSTDHALDPQAFAPPPGLHGPALPDLTDFGRLQARRLRVPVEGLELSGLRDNFAEKRGARVHEAIDIPAPRGTPVLAVDDGVVKKLFTSGAGGLTVYQYDPSETFCYYYAHLDRYAEGLAEGKVLKKGDRVGYVGTTGNAPPDTPHLHFTIFKLGDDKRWWEGTPINPYPLWAMR